MAQEKSIRELVDMIPGLFVPERAAGVKAVVQANITGEGGGDWYLTLLDQTVTVREGAASQPNLTLSAAAQDVLDIYYRRLDPMKAFMQGKVRMIGDTGLAMRLLGMFRMP